MPWLELDMMRLCGFAGFFQGVDLVEIHAGILPDRFGHGETGKRLAKVHFDAVVDDLRGSQDFLRNIAIEILREVHHAMVIGIGLIELHEGELRIVPGVEALVAENTADFIDSFQTADDQAL